MSDPLFPTYYWLKRPWEARGCDIVGTDPDDGDYLAIAQVTGKTSGGSPYSVPTRDERAQIAAYIAGAPQRIAALTARIAELEKVADAGCKLWAVLLTNRTCWEWELMQDIVKLGLLEAVDMNAEDSGPECDHCNGDCGTCYRPTALLATPPTAPENQP
jgi:hypothetical protein